MLLDDPLDLPPEPCLGGGLCGIWIKFEPVLNTVNEEVLVVQNPCPRHGAEWMGGMNGFQLFRMCEKGDRLGLMIYKAVREQQGRDRYTESEIDRHRPANAMMPRFHQPTPSDTIMLEYAEAERQRVSPGQRGLTPA